MRKFSIIIIFFLSLAAVAVSNVLKFSKAESPATVNPYLEILQEADFDFDCEAASPLDVEKSSGEADLDEIDRMTSVYHRVINCLFNRNMEAMEELGESDKKEDREKYLALLNPPQLKLDPETKLPMGRESCLGNSGTKNLSTYCLSQETLGEYFKYRAALFEARRVAGEEALRQIGDVKQVPPEKLSEFNSRVDLIEREKENAKTSLDEALVAYSEFQMALPLHQKFEQTLDALEDYRDQVRDLRRIIDDYPATFIDITTPACL